MQNVFKKLKQKQLQLVIRNVKGEIWVHGVELTRLMFALIQIFAPTRTYGFKGTCEPCLNDGNPSTCGGGFPCRTTTKPDGCNRNKCHSFDCEQHPGYACHIGESGWGGEDAGQYGTWELCQQNKYCKGTPSPYVPGPRPR